MSTIYKIKLKFIKSQNTNIENCSTENKINILREIYKRLLIPIYIPILTLIPFLLIITSKENIHYLKLRILVFFLGISTIIFSETTIRFIDVILINNIKFIIIPLIILLIVYFTFIYYFQLKFKKIYENLYKIFINNFFKETVLYISHIQFSIYNEFIE